MIHVKAMKILVSMIFCVAIVLFAREANAASRIKDIADFEGIRDNQLVGYGLVVGLNGTGDNIKSVDFTRESLISMLDKIGINARGGQIKSKNIAAVMVTANLPPFSRQGSRIDVMVSALGDAKNLQGGTLLVTPLVGADGAVYAVAQECGIEPKALFNAMYQALIGKDQGPRLASFMKIIGKSRLEAILSVYC